MPSPEPSSGWFFDETARRRELTIWIKLVLPDPHAPTKPTTVDSRWGARVPIASATIFAKDSLPKRSGAASEPSTGSSEKPRATSVTSTVCLPERAIG